MEIYDQYNQLFNTLHHNYLMDSDHERILVDN